MKRAWSRGALLVLGLLAACSRPMTPSTEHLPTFRDYLDVALFDPAVGYYATGRVDLRADFRTFPVALAPAFGQMVAEQVFRMWEGMRRAGTLGADEKFTVAEVGAGDGMLAETFLDCVGTRAATDVRWRLFEAQLRYWSFDRSPALSERQRARNARFANFEARSGDATNLAVALPANSITGVILSNELLDCFSVHKVTWDESGAHVVYVKPSLDGVAIDDFGTRIRTLSTAQRARLHIDEVYAPLDSVPDVAEHVRRYKQQYAQHASVAYVNLGATKFIRDAGAALRAGYVLTIDYGAGWRGSLAGDTEHLRIYGRDVQAGNNPYDAPTLHDITTDVNFGEVAAEGQLAGLDTKYFGPQRSMRAGTDVVIEPPPGANPDDFHHWADLFETWDVYKVLIQQKRGTDAAYTYPGGPAEDL